MRVYVDPAPGGEAVNLALALRLGRHAEGDPSFEVAHVYRPPGRVVVFGRREVKAPGFPAAVRAAREAGFEPLVRAAGGRAVAYTEQSVVVHHVSHDPDPTQGHDARFIGFGHALVDALGDLGVAAQLGAVPGEYCPGAHSVNARGEAKLVGTAQRILRRSWLFASLVVVGDEAELRSVLAQVYGHLDQPFDPRAVGSLSAENPSLDADVVLRSLVSVYAGAADAEPVGSLGLLVDDAARASGDQRVQP